MTAAPRKDAPASDPPVFLTAFWRDLAMLNFEADPELLAPYVPAGTRLDAYEGRTLVSIVGFMFFETRVAGLAIPGHRTFEEVNLRFYVRRESSGQRRRGVVFLKELVPLRAVAWTARAFYGERYEAVTMRHDQVEKDRQRSVIYEWTRKSARGRIALTTAGPPSDLVEGSEEEFITDHAWGYVARHGRQSLEYRVDHPRWRIWKASSVEFDCDAEAFYGAALAPILDRPPVSAYLAEGSEVAVRRGRTIDA